MSKIKSISKDELINNLDKSKQIFYEIKNSLPILLQNQKNLNFEELFELSNIISILKENMNEIKKNIKNKNKNLIDFDLKELQLLTDKTGISKEILEDFIKFNKILDNYNFEKEFYKQKDIITKKIAEKEKEKAEEILKKQKKAIKQKQIEEEKKKNKIEENILSAMELF